MDLKQGRPHESLPTPQFFERFQLDINAATQVVVSSIREKTTVNTRGKQVNAEVEILSSRWFCLAAHVRHSLFLIF